MGADLVSASLGFCFRCRPGLGPAADSLSFASPKESKQRKGEPNSLALRARCVARIARGAHKLVCYAAFGHVRPLSGRSCATRQRMTAGGALTPALSQREREQDTPAGREVRTRSRFRFRFCRVAGLSSAGARGSEVRMSEGRAADKFADLPRDTSSARKPAGPRTSARLFFGYFLLAKQKKVARPPGRDPARHERRQITSKRTTQ